MPFGGLINTSHTMGKGELSSKTPHFGDVNGDFQLERLRAYLSKAETYNNAWWLKMRFSARRTMCNLKKGWGHFRGQIYKSLFQRQICSQISKHFRKKSNNFLTVHDARKTSTDHHLKTDAVESISDIRICLWHHLAAKTTSGLNLQG
jgi:hypothetical protein